MYVINKNFIHEYDYKCLSLNKALLDMKAIKLNPAFKVLSIVNCPSIDCLVNDSLKIQLCTFIKQTSHLFIICIDLNQDLDDLREADLTFLQLLTEEKRPLVIQLTSNVKGQTLFLFKNDKEKRLNKVVNLQPISWEVMCKELNSGKTSSFELLLQALASSWLGSFGGSLKECKLNPYVSRGTMRFITKQFASSCSLCLRFMLLFSTNDEENPILPSDIMTSCLELPGIERISAALDLPIKIDSEHNGEEAFSRKKQEVMKSACRQLIEKRMFSYFTSLVCVGSQYPDNFDLKIVDDSISFQKLHRLIDERQNFHDNIASGSLEKVKEFTRKKSNLKTVFNLYNKSALTTALESRQFHIHAFLQSKGFSKEGDASYNTIWSKMIPKVKHETQLHIREANKKFFGDIEDKHLVTLLSKTRLGLDSFECDNDYFKKFVQCTWGSTQYKTSSPF